MTREQLIKARDALGNHKSVPPKGVTTGDATFRVEFTGENIETLRTLINKALEEPIEGPRSAKLAYTISKIEDSLRKSGITGSYWNDGLNYLQDYARRQLNQGETR